MNIRNELNDEEELEVIDIDDDIEEEKEVVEEENIDKNTEKKKDKKEKSKNKDIYKIGDNVLVKVLNTSKEYKTVYFTLISHLKEKELKKNLSINNL